MTSWTPREVKTGRPNKSLGFKLRAKRNSYPDLEVDEAVTLPCPLLKGQRDIVLAYRRRAKRHGHVYQSTRYIEGVIVRRVA